VFFTLISFSLFLYRILPGTKRYATYCRRHPCMSHGLRDQRGEGKLRSLSLQIIYLGRSISIGILLQLS
jgi:hypothetical protein